MSKSVVALRPFLLEQSFGLAVALLLAPVLRDRVAAVMPDERAGVETDLASARLQSPTHVNIVARGAVARVEAIDRCERCTLEGHVAPGDVLGLGIADQYMDWSARGAGNAVCNESIARGRDVRAADTDVVRGHERVGNVMQPVRVRIGVVIDVRNDLAGGCSPTGVARIA